MVVVVPVVRGSSLAGIAPKPSESQLHAGRQACGVGGEPWGVEVVGVDIDQYIIPRTPALKDTAQLSQWGAVGIDIGS